ncbi:Kinesin-like protein KIN-14E (Kinesin-like calmodulin-binding protein) (Protein ZWICHEL) [Durusdinium trenchii]|uniref:Kinesin-like protein KIN-14E (Kinesin-like calmodulin-binding protein) (Protein ZWICHEL) n=1 Tax=Durusdinium trenchii TaxID=1381693 RepID=A0ABP0MYI9_9DINO
MDELTQGSSCVTLAVVTVRQEDSLSSQILGHFNVGSQLKVLQLSNAKPGELLRAEVKSASMQGWITVRNTGGQALVGMEANKVSRSTRLEDVMKGSQLETLRLMTLRAGEALSSECVGQLPPHTRITVLEVLAEPQGALRRAKISTLESSQPKEGRMEGWASLCDSKGNVLVRIAGTSTTRPKVKETVDEGGSKKQANLAIGLLQSARSGEFQKFKEIAEAVAREGDETPISPSRRRDSPLDCCDVRGRTPLIYAAAFGSVNIVEFLLSKDEVYVNALDDTQKTALHHAARHSQADILRLLLNGGAMTEARDHNGCTALMFAAGTGNMAGLQVLLEKQANPGAEDYQGNSALSYAKDLNHQEIVEKLIAAGAVEDAQEESTVQKNRKRRVRTETVAQADLEEAAAVALEVFEPGLSEEEQRRSAAEKRLVELQHGSSLRDLEAALEGAVQAGVTDESLLNGANKRLEELQERDQALDHLLAAIDEIQQQENKPVGMQGLTSLEEALQKAKEKGVSQKDLERGQGVFQAEVPRAKARQELREAQRLNDARALRDAIEEAKKCQLSEEEMQPFEELLRGAESKEAAEAALKKAQESRDIDALTFALQQAREAGVDASMISQGEDILKEEAPKHEARQQLAIQLAKVRNAGDEGPSLEDLSLLQEAIDQAKSVQLPEPEYAQALSILAQEQKRATCKAEVAQVLAEVKEVDKTSIESVEAAKEKLSNALLAAKASAVHSMALREADAYRRRLHNMVEDLKGSIRVFCRIRPLSQREKDLKDTDVSSQVDTMTVNVQKPSAGSIPNDIEQFNFDAVFKPGSQAEVFDTCKDLVQSALDGYNVTMFAYGQTGAGKTFTMYGGRGDMQGTAPRTIDELYRLMKKDEDRVRFTVMASMMELYRNELVDLLTQKPGAGASPKRKSQRPETAAMDQKLNVRVDKTGAVQIEHLYEEECKTAQALSDLLERGNQMRTVCATKMNSESSRSHLILVIRVVGVNKETEQKLSGKILLCDLAGSERLKKSDVSGEAQKEAIEINKSLTALGDVMEALVKGNAHVPYKNHKLTQVMSDALGGTSKTLMFVNCSPASSNFEETLMTLKFASRAKTITNDVKRKMIAKAKPMPKA